MKIGIVVADYRKEMTDKMLAVALDELKSNEVDVEVLSVPGAYEIPLAVKKLVKKEEIDGVVCIGVVIQGDTDHDLVCANNALRLMADLSVEFEKPVCSSIIGPRVSEELAKKRVEIYPKHAANAVVRMVNVLR
jgi:6,7-dimethyl-8-ribityllumazine synthase